MSKELIVTSNPLETKVAILDGGKATEIFIERSRNLGILGNIYKGKVMKVLPGMQAAFVDIGLDRNAFLYVSDFLEDLEEYEELYAGGREEGEISFFDSDLPLDIVQGSEKKGLAERVPDSKPARSRKKTRAKRSASRKTRKAVQSNSREVPAPSRTPQILPSTLELPEGVSTKTDSLEPKMAIGSILPFRLEEIPLGKEKEEKRTEAILELPPEESSFSIPAKNKSRVRRKTNMGNNGENALIGDLVKEGQEILVQVSKEPIGKKGARITSHIALPGRYLVFMPTVDHVGISRRIVSPKERSRLRKTILDLRGEFQKGFIVRTAGENHSQEELHQDMIYLTQLWEEVRTKSEKGSAPALIHSEPRLLERVIRDYVSDDYSKIRLDDEELYAYIVEFINRFNPKLVKTVSLYRGKTPIFERYKVDQEIEKALKHKIWLKTGGHIVIHQTEALVAIDVNTGKFVGSTNSLEDTITQANLDAVAELVRQLRLRDLGGIIVVDFIDMDERENRQKVLDTLYKELAKDKAPSKILNFNEFGLVILTRKRAKQSLERILCQPCQHCEGTGLTKSVTTTCYTIHEKARKLLPHLGKAQALRIRCHPDVAKALRTVEKLVVTEIEKMTERRVSTQSDPLLAIEQFKIEEISSD